MRGDRTPGPERWLCPQCAFDLYTRMSDLDIAAHAVHHRQAHHINARLRNVPITRSELEDYVVELVRYAAELEHECSRLRGRVADRDDVIESLEADLDFEQRQGAERVALIDDLEGDLYRIRGGQDPAP